MSFYGEKQKGNTLQFFAEFKAVQALRSQNNPDLEEDLSTSNDSAFREEIADAVRPFHPFPKTGEIRLLSHLDKITYGAILSWDWCHSVFIPMSHYESAATDREMRAETGERRGLFQQVYQCWNARTINNTLLAKSWVAGRISEEEITKLKKMMQYSLLGDALPEEIKNLTGTPIFRQEDPRLVYMQEEAALFAELDAMDLALENKRTVIFESSFDQSRKPIPFPAVQEFLQAAAGENNLSGVYTVDEDGKASFITAVECEDFEKVAEKSPLPHFTWFTETADPLTEYSTVFFRHSVTGRLIGTGMIFPDQDGVVLQLLNGIPGEEVPEINTQSEIEIILQ